MGDDAAPAVDAFEAIKAKYAALKAPILAERAPYAEKLAALNSSFTEELTPLLATQRGDVAIEAKITAGESIDALQGTSKGRRDALLAMLAGFDGQLLQILTQESDETKKLEAEKAAAAAAE